MCARVLQKKKTKLRTGSACDVKHPTLHLVISLHACKKNEKLSLPLKGAKYA
jgi:hypothetical protein